jgi:hypothetical protein
MAVTIKVWSSCYEEGINIHGLLMAFRILCSLRCIGIKLQTRLFEIKLCLTFWTHQGIAWLPVRELDEAAFTEAEDAGVIWSYVILEHSVVWILTIPLPEVQSLK